MNLYKINNRYAPKVRVYIVLSIAILFVTVLCYGCKKFVEVEALSDKLLASQVFSDDASANAALAGIYRSQRNSLPIQFTIYNSLVSNDVVNFTSNTIYDDYRDNNLQVTSATLGWPLFYKYIYEANGIIEGIAASKSMSEKAKEYYTGEAKFQRAFSYFYLVNLFGDVPLITSTDINQNAVAKRADVADVYKLIIADLKDAQAKLGVDYSFTGGERIRANKWVATSLLARTYLYLKDWANAEVEATKVINAGLYSLINTQDGIFAKNNTEAILQLANNAGESNTPAASFIFTTTPVLICTDPLLNTFEIGDKRKSTWINSKVYLSKTYYFPNKFTTTATTTTEYFTLIRLAELYLIRSEARAEQNNLPDALTDLNLVRQKHGGLLALPSSTERDALRTAILKERRVELFTEGMHRWFDLKRTGLVHTVLQMEKPLTWKPNAALYPVPLSDIQRNINLTQNPGY